MRGMHWGHAMHGNIGRSPHVPPLSFPFPAAQIWRDTIHDTIRDKLVANEASEIMTTHVVRTASSAARSPGVRGADACAPSATEAGKGAAHED